MESKEKTLRTTKFDSFSMHRKCMNYFCAHSSGLGSGISYISLLLGLLGNSSFCKAKLDFYMIFCTKIVDRIVKMAYSFQRMAQLTSRPMGNELANIGLGNRFSSDHIVTHFTMRDCPGKAEQTK